MRVLSNLPHFVQRWRSASLPVVLLALAACGGGGSVEIVSATAEPTPLKPSSTFTVKVQIRGDRCLSTKVYLKRSDASEQFDELTLNITKSHSTSCGDDSFEGECWISDAAPNSTARYLTCGPLDDYSAILPRPRILLRSAGPLIFRVVAKSSVSSLDFVKTTLGSLGLYDTDVEVTSLDFPAVLE